MDYLSQFNVIDIMVLAVVILGAVRGWVKGLSGELAGLISIGAAALIGWIGYRPFGELIWQHTRLSESAAYLWAFILLLIGGYVLMRLIRLFLKVIMEFSFKPPIEKMGGALAGIIKTTVICATFILLMGLLPNPSAHALFAEKSCFGQVAYKYLGPVYESLAERYPALRIDNENKTDSEFEDESSSEDENFQPEDGESSGYPN